MTTDKKDSNHLIRVTFSCSICWESASTVMLVPRGVHEPDLPVQNDDAAVIVVDGPHVKRASKVPERAYADLRRAIDNVDASALSSCSWHKELAPFYCPECQACYCIEHTEVRHTFDQGFHDGALGWCPRGHRRWLD